MEQLDVGLHPIAPFSLNENVKTRHISNFLKEIYYIS